MRRLAYLMLGLAVFSSCTALKPMKAANSGAGHDPAAGPRFIENITINNGTGAKPDLSARPLDQNWNGARLDKAPGSGIEVLEPYRFKFAILMDMAVEELDNSRLFEFIEQWYGTRYHFGGNSKDGIDCSAFSGALFSAVYGIEIPRMARDQFHASQRVRKEELQEGDLVFFHTTRKGVSHVGVYLANNKFVHASLNYGVVISDLNDPYYHRKFVGAGRPRPALNAAVSTQ